MKLYLESLARQLVHSMDSTQQQAETWTRPLRRRLCLYPVSRASNIKVQIKSRVGNDVCNSGGGVEGPAH